MVEIDDMLQRLAALRSNCPLGPSATRAPGSRSSLSQGRLVRPKRRSPMRRKCTATPAQPR